MPAAEKTNWESSETWQRVVASIIATGVKIDLKETAKYYGATYDTLENRFRKIKKLAVTLKEEVGSGERGEVEVKPATPRKPRTPKTPKTKDALSSVANGRVSKTPSASAKKNGVKKEQFDSAASSFMDGYEDMGVGSFAHEDFAFTGGDLFDGMQS